MSALPVVYRAEAQEDLDATYLEYEQLRAGLGSRFHAAVDARLDMIEAHPRLYGVVYRRVRAAQVRRFPYVIYYRVERTYVSVIAVQHERRDWSNWTSRI